MIYIVTSSDDYYPEAGADDWELVYEHAMGVFYDAAWSF